MKVNEITYKVRGAVFEVYNVLGPGLLESTYEAALEMGKPEIFNTDQGSQFTSNLFTSELLNREIQVSIN